MKTVWQLHALFFCTIFNALASTIIISKDFLQPKTICYKNILKKITTLFISSTAVIGTYLHNKSHTHQEDFSDGKIWSTCGDKENSYLLHLHGWMSHANKKNDFFCDNFLMISPRFEETLTKKLYRCFFGQEKDVLRALITLKETKDQIKDKISAITYSRGSAVYTALIAVLSQQDHYLLEKAGILEEERIFFLNCFKNGRCILISPLISMKTVLEYRFTKYFGGIFGHYIFLPLVSGFRYNSRALTSLGWLEQWQNQLHIPLWIIFPSNDMYIGNQLRGQFIQKLYEKNGQNFTKIVRVESNKHLCKKFFEIAKNILVKKEA